LVSRRWTRCLVLAEVLDDPLPGKDLVVADEPKVERLLRPERAHSVARVSEDVRREGELVLVHADVLGDPAARRGRGKEENDDDPQEVEDSAASERHGTACQQVVHQR
jgi:hypothetical protein